MYVVYHEPPRASEHANALANGLLIVRAESPEAARHYVTEHLGDAFHGCAVEEIKCENKTGVLIEFWRQSPKRIPRVVERAVAA